MLLALACQLGNIIHSLRPYPLLRPELRLEGTVDTLLLPAESFAQQTRRFNALAVIGIALVQETLGYAMVGRHQHFGYGISGCVGLTHRVGQRIKIERMLKISRYGTQGRLPLELHQSAESMIIGGGGGRRGVLRIEREKQDALTALGLQPTQHTIR